MIKIGDQFHAKDRPQPVYVAEHEHHFRGQRWIAGSYQYAANQRVGIDLPEDELTRVDFTFEVVGQQLYAEYRAKLDRANAWVDTQRGRNGWASYRPESAPDYVNAVSNDLRSHVELFELARDKPARVVAYTAAPNLVVNWLGVKLGTYRVRSAWRDRHGNGRRCVVCDLPGLGRYRGLTAREDGWFIRLSRL